MSVEYKEILTSPEASFRWINDYSNFGWKYVDSKNSAKSTNVKVRLKRPSELVNKTELIRLESQFESCRKEIEDYEKSIKDASLIFPLSLGILGVLFLILFFAVKNPLRYVFVILALLFFVLPFIFSKKISNHQRKKLAPFILQKEKEIQNVLQKASVLV